MQSRDLIRDNLEKSRERVLAHVEQMRDFSVVSPTPRGGAHTLWVLGHLAYIEGLVIHEFMLGKDNPLAPWAEMFDGAEIRGEASDFPGFDEVLRRCRDLRDATLRVLESLSEGDLDRPASRIPVGWEDTFGTYRRCLQYVADHWYMHRGNPADARRAAGVGRMWV